MTAGDGNSMDEPAGAANDPGRTRRTAALRDDVHRHARERLVPAMAPARIVVVDELPKLPNGKVDRAKLSAVGTEGTTPDAQPGETAATPAEAAVCSLWADVLGLERIDVEADFFQLGGTSLTAVRMAARWTAAGGAPFDMARFLADPTVRQLVRLAGRRPWPAEIGGARPVRVEADELARLAVLPADVRPAGSARLAGPSLTRVLVTGMSSCVEPFIIRKFLDRPGTTVHVVISAPDVESASERLRGRMASHGLWRAEDAGRLTAVPGDLTQPYLGMRPETYRRLERGIDQVVHAGDCFGHRSSLKQLTPGNVLGTQEVLRFAASEVVKTVHFVSVLSVGSWRTEPDATAGGLRQSKWVGEQFMRQAAARGIPTCTYRLGQVSAVRNDTVDLGDEFLAAMVRTCVSLRVAPDLDLAFPVASAEHVADTLVAGALDESGRGRAERVVADQAVSWREIVSNIRSIGRAVQVVGYGQWRRTLLESVERSEIHALTPFLSLVRPDGLCPSLGYEAGADYVASVLAGRASDVDAAGRELLRTCPARFDDIRTAGSAFVVREHRTRVPLDHAAPDGPTIEIYAQEVVATEREHDDLPWLLFLQGGPGAPCPAPDAVGSWLTTALEGHRVLLLDQRGGGRSTPVTVRTAADRSPAELAAYLRHFRADSIVADAEILRGKLAGGGRWSILGQSYGGFIALTYLSMAPEGLSAALVSGGVPGIEAPVDEVYDRTYAELVRKNAAYYAEYPEDVHEIRRLAAHLDENDVRLPGGDRLTSRRLRLLGRNLGMSHGFERVHNIVRQAWDGDEISDSFRQAVVAETGFVDMQLYALQEFIYAGPGRPTGWAAHRALARFAEFEAGAVPLLLIGEMIYPWMFEEFSELVPFAEAAGLLAGAADFRALYDLDRLTANEVPLVALVYADDLYSPVELQLRTAETVGNTQVLATDEFHHNGLMRNATLLERLLAMVKDEPRDGDHLSVR
ncbi:alpha/beta fold hydrolase [Amycolatopsis sp. NPDC051045]|uniref:alpha/beta fold hydrolase n=1 Tax=Amycolatopsis sp. NPDC051045 TaxID=3156922 RepID=UPI0034268856